MCLFCATTKLRTAPTLTKKQILNPKAEGLAGSDKPWAVVVGHSTDAVDGATRVESARQHAEGFGYRVVKWPKPPKIGIQAEPFSGNAKGATLVVRVECHGAPGWTLGKDGRFESEVLAAYDLKWFICCTQQALGRPVDAVVFRSCYSAVEYAGGSGASFLMSSARIASFLLPGVHVFGFLGEDNGSSKVTHLEDQGGAESSLSIEQGTASFFNGALTDGASNPQVFAKIKSQSVREELRNCCDVHLERLPLTFINEDRRFMMQNRVFISVTPPKSPL